jgi:hypothetical protein
LRFLSDAADLYASALPEQSVFGYEYAEIMYGGLADFCGLQSCAACRVSAPEKDERYVFLEIPENPGG